MDIYSVLMVAGGLALFLFGMEVMGSGLRKISGGTLEKVLEKMTSTPMKGVLLGAAVTAVIQSSSATTVMVVGFVNSGIMQLYQSIGIIMGANIGTTVTAWILSLSGIEGSSLLVQLLKPANFSPIFAVIGIAMMMFGRQIKTKDIGSILIGFAVLMFGMTTMSDAVKPLAENESFSNILLMFSNPVLGVLAGALLTAVIQSSSASVGILQALSVTGSITYGSAIPIIIGQNIGTCVTALISCIGANKNAKRAAMVHLYFNIIGAVIFLSLFYLLNAIFKFSFVSEALNPANIAIVHTAFNVLSTAILLPFAKRLGQLATLTIRDKKEPEEVPIIDERFLATPSFAIEVCRSATTDMANTVKKNVFRAIDSMEHFDKNIEKEIEEREGKVDKYEDAIGTFLVKLTGNELSLHDSQEAAKMLHAIGDFERIADHAVGVMHVAKELHDKDLNLSEGAQADLRVMTTAVKDIVDLAFDAFENDNVENAYKVEPMEQVVDYLKAELKRRHIERLQEGRCTIEAGFIFSDLITSYERISDHCSNLAVYLIQIPDDQLDAHEYLHAVKAGETDYMKDYKRYKARYKLPE